MARFPPSQDPRVLASARASAAIGGGVLRKCRFSSPRCRDPKGRSCLATATSPLARTCSGTSWNGSFPKILTGSAVSNSAGTVAGSSHGSSLRARAGSWRPGWRAEPHASPAFPRFFFFFLTIRARELEERRTDRETGQGEGGPGSFPDKEPPGAQTHQSANKPPASLPPHSGRREPIRST